MVSTEQLAQLLGMVSRPLGKMISREATSTKHTEIGLATDYTELPELDTLVPRRSIELRHFWRIGVIAIVIAAVIPAPRIMAPKGGYIVCFGLTRHVQSV